MRIDRATVVDAGVRLVGDAGLGALGVRAVAGELSVTPMALYRHIGDAATLHTAVLDRLLSELPQVPPDGQWDERCRAWAFELRDTVSQYPGLATLVLTGWTQLAPCVLMVNGLGAMLELDGPNGIDAVAGSNALLTYVLARVQAEEAVGAQGLVRDLSSWDELGSDAAFMNAHRAEYEIARIDEHFTYGLDALLRGLSSARRRGRRARS